MSWNDFVQALTSIQLRIWYNLKIAVHHRNPSNLKELEQFCLEECAKIQTYPKRLAAVNAA
jgi:hypothetical protein